MPWYVSIGGQTYGPAEPESLREWRLAGTLAATDFVWDEASQTWVEAGRVPALSGIFADLPAPTIGIQEIDELPRSAALLPESQKTMESFCANHADDPAVAVCPRCQRSVCSRCMAPVDGLSICVDCDAEQKSDLTKSRKRLVLTWSAPAVLIVGMLSVYTVLAPAPAEQPDEPVVVALEKGEAPRLSPEDLSPEEKQKVEADLRALAAAFAAWKTETPAGAGRMAREPSDSWIGDLAAAAVLPEPLSPPRGDLLYRLGDDGKQVELWTTGSLGRAFVVLKGDSITFIPRSLEPDVPAAGRP